MTSAGVKLYRGFDTKLAEGITRNPYLESPRIPKHANKLVHQYADDWFRHWFGVAARSSTIICSTDVMQAATFAKPEGCLATIQPLGNCQLLYSASIRDFLQYATEGVTADQASVWGWLDDQDYQCVASPEMISPLHAGEVLVHCQSFNLQHIAIPAGDDG